MTDIPPGPEGSPEGKVVANKKLERFVKSFESSAKHSADLEEAIDELAGIIDDEKTGLISVMAVLVDELRGFRKDLRAAAQAGGLGVIFDALRGGR